MFNMQSIYHSFVFQPRP